MPSWHLSFISLLCMQIWDRWERVSHSHSVRMISLIRLTWQSSLFIDTTISTPLLPLIVCGHYLCNVHCPAINSAHFSLYIRMPYWSPSLHLFSFFPFFLYLIPYNKPSHPPSRPVCSHKYHSALLFIFPLLWLVICFVINDRFFIRCYDIFYWKTVWKWKQTTKNLAKHSSKTSKNIHSRLVKKLKEISWLPYCYFTLINWYFNSIIVLNLIDFFLYALIYCIITSFDVLACF